MRDSFFWRNARQQNIILNMIDCSGRRSDILEVGCSTGEMIMTYALLFEDIFGENWYEGIRIDAIDSGAGRIEIFKRGIYLKESLYKMPPKFLGKFSEVNIYTNIHFSMNIYLLNMEILSHINKIHSDFQSFQAARAYDFIFMQNVLCHVPELQKEFIEKAYILLKHKGFLVCAGRSEGSGAILKDAGFVPYLKDIVKINNEFEHLLGHPDEKIRTKLINEDDEYDPYEVGTIFQKF